MTSWLGRVRAALAELGLDASGVVGRARYDAAAPARLGAAALGAPLARSVIVVASTGRSHWERFLAWIGEHPVERLGRTADPLDAFTTAGLAAIAPLLAEQGPFLTVQPTLTSPIHLDFVALGRLAGIGAPGALGILLSPRHGPWLALRAAIFTPAELPEDAPLPTAPCLGCPAPCAAVCPAEIVGHEPFPHLRCAEERARNPRCRDGCGARAACVVAPGEAYDELEVRYHYHRAAGRRALVERFGVRDEVSPEALH